MGLTLEAYLGFNCAQCCAQLSGLNLEVKYVNEHDSLGTTFEVNIRDRHLRPTPEDDTRARHHKSGLNSEAKYLNEHDNLDKIPRPTSQPDTYHQNNTSFSI